MYLQLSEMAPAARSRDLRTRIKNEYVLSFFGDSLAMLATLYNLYKEIIQIHKLIEIN